MINSYVFAVLMVFGIIALCSWLEQKQDKYWDAAWFLGSIKGFGLALVAAIAISSFLNDEAFETGCIVACIAAFVFELAVFLVHLVDCSSLIVRFLILMILFVMIVGGGVCVKEQSNIVVLSDPEVVETRYDIIRCEFGEPDYFKLYYIEEKDTELVAVSMTIPEEKTTVVLMNNQAEPEYVIKSEQIFYRENRNVEPYEVSVDHIETSYKLYVNVD